MANTVITLEDLHAFERRMRDYIDQKLAQVAGNQRPLFYKPKEVAQMSGLTVHAIRHRLRDPNEKLLKGLQEAGVCGSWLIPRESVDAWLESMRGKGGRR